MKTGITFSAFDLLHPGHLLMLKFAKENCDHLIVGLHTDPSIERKNKNRPVQTTYERFLQLQGCKYVDEIIPYDTEQDLINILMTRFPDVRILGADYEEKDFTGKKECEHLIEIIYAERMHSFSSSGLRKRLLVN